jgi:hypothetical protein
MILSIVWFGACAVALVAITWIIRREDPEITVTAMFDQLMADRTIRVVIILIWWWLGWHVLAGQTVDPPGLP